MNWPKPIFIGDEKPGIGRSVLLDNGDRVVVGHRRKDDKFYTDQDGKEFWAQYWCPLPSWSPEEMALPVTDPLIRS